MAGGVVLGEIVCQIMLSSHPIYQKFSLPDSVSGTVKSHVDCSWTLLANVVVDKPVSCGTACHWWGGWLGVAHLCEHHAHWCASLTVKKNRYQLCFHWASEEVSHGCKSDMNWSIEGLLLFGGLVAIHWYCAEVMIPSWYALGFSIWYEGSVDVDMEDNYTWVIYCDGLRIRGGII